MKSGYPTTAAQRQYTRMSIPSHPQQPRGHAWHADNKYGHYENEVGVLLYELSSIPVPFHLPRKRS